MASVFALRVLICVEMFLLRLAFLLRLEELFLLHLGEIFLLHLTIFVFFISFRVESGSCFFVEKYFCCTWNNILHFYWGGEWQLSFCGEIFLLRLEFFFAFLLGWKVAVVFRG